MMQTQKQKSKQVPLESALRAGNEMAKSVIGNWYRAEVLFVSPPGGTG